MGKEWNGNTFLGMVGGMWKLNTVLITIRTYYWMEITNRNGQGQQTYDNFYQDFEDFFENAQRQYGQQQQQQQSWSYDDIFGTRTGMSRQEAYKVLGLQYEIL